MSKRLTVAVFIALLTLTSCRSSGPINSPGVTVEIVNESGKTIKTVQLWDNDINKSDSAPFKTLGPIEDGQKVRVVLAEITGEGSYATQVIFADGKELTVAGTYVEGGYHATETIKATEIISEIDFY